ncbi:hypothetical protein EV424DRAFT_1347509 [Suillus variegatus]|nr:hypothetical protein EV424DRAFT_1347509 [Suillus variegatus]
MFSDMRGYKGWNGLINFPALPLCLAFRHTSLLLPLVLEAGHYVREQPIWWPRAPRARPSLNTALRIVIESDGELFIADVKVDGGGVNASSQVSVMLKGERNGGSRTVPVRHGKTGVSQLAPKSDTELVWTWWWFYWRRGMMGVGEWRLRVVIFYQRAEVFQERHDSNGGHFAIMAENICTNLVLLTSALFHYVAEVLNIISVVPLRRSNSNSVLVNSHDMSEREIDV